MATRKTTPKPSKSTPRPRKSKSKTHVLRGLPVLWSQRLPTQAIGFHLDQNEVWAGWESGEVVACSLDGQVLRRWRLPAGVDALVADELWRYAGCRDGNIYDLTGEVPRVAYEVDKTAHIQWIDIYRGNLCASDSHGSCTVVDVEQNVLWKSKPGGNSGWMVRAAASGVYLGNSQGVTRFDWKGNVIWMQPTDWVGFGWPGEKTVYAFTGPGQTNAAVIEFYNETGEIKSRGSCYSKEKHYKRPISAASCAASTDGERIFGATCETIFCFHPDGSLRWEAPAPCGTPCSMAYQDDKLYVATHLGVLACLDVSDAAVERARTEQMSAAQSNALQEISVSARDVKEATSEEGGVVVECVRMGKELRVRVVSPGYREDWFCQFPRDIREEGARFVVDQVREASQGGFYRVLGNIRRLRKD
ncbi:MAG TPA: PQQ-binding-like beta-propeller repeat protein [Polyangium sp.]|nr:PQQ-binding-like beta-propeller repeat protein [Polyangium sp.]